MTEIALGKPVAAGEHRDRATRAIIIALGFVLCLQLGLAFTKSINWDEFFHFSQIQANWRGEDVGSLLQRPFVPLFGWVPSLGGENIDQIHLIRSLIMPFELLLVGAIIAAARRFTDLATALLCGLAYVTAGYAFTQGLALRADVISASLVMSALAIGLHRKPGPVTLATMAVLTALAFVATIKVVLYLPAFLALAILRWDEVKRWIWLAPLGGIIGIVGIAFAAPDALATFEHTLSGSFQRMFGGGLFPQHMHWVRQSAMASVFTVLLLGFGIWLIKGKSVSKLALALLAVPALWPIIYFNSYPYFFAFILPPVAVALVPVIKIAAERYGDLALAAIFTLNAVALFAMDPRESHGNQEQVQALVSEAFPAPAAYIDESGMIGNFPRAVPQFASGWALSAYLERGEPIYSRAILERPVPLVLANCLTLRNAFSDNPVGERFLPEDEALLRANYIQHAGIVMVAGKRLAAGAILSDELVAVPGDYRIEGDAIAINGEVFEVGSVVSLKRTGYNFGNAGSQDAALRWADAGEPQDSDITFLDLYSGY